MFDVAVVGAGWSGLACALACSDAGARVALLDAAPQAGGRARRVRLRLGDRDYALDNGQHLLIGAYRETERLMRRVGVDPARALLRLPLTMVYPDGFRFTASALPAPLHLAAGLITAHGMSLADRVALVRLMRSWKSSEWNAPPAATAASILDAATPKLIERFFEPLCLAALNLRLADAGARMFLTVMRDSIGASRRDSEFWVPRTDLSALAPDAAIVSLTRSGTAVRLSTLATGISKTPAGWKILCRSDAQDCAAVVLALPPERAQALLASSGIDELDEATDLLSGIESAPIATVYLRYAAATRLPCPVTALVEAPARGHFGQWVFDRGALDANNDGVMGVVVSGRGPHMELPHDELARKAAEQLREVLSLPAPIAAATIVERRATVLATPALVRPATRLPCQGLYLAGDSADSPYPSTIEGSVRAGLTAAAAWKSDHAPAAESVLERN